MYLEKPDPTKPVFDLFPEARELTQHRRCPICKRIVNTYTGHGQSHEPERLSSFFRDDLSRKEYSISGMCQDCQDEMFGE